MSIEDAINIRLRGGNKLNTQNQNIHETSKSCKVFYTGKHSEYHHMSLQELASLRNLKYTTVYNRIHVCHWTMDEAFEFEVKEHKSKSKKIYTGNDERFKNMNLGDVAKFLNIPYDKVYHRIYFLNWSVDEALEIIPRKK